MGNRDPPQGFDLVLVTVEQVARQQVDVRSTIFARRLGQPDSRLAKNSLAVIFPRRRGRSPRGAAVVDDLRRDVIVLRITVAIRPVRRRVGVGLGGQVRGPGPTLVTESSRLATDLVRVGMIRS